MTARPRPSAEHVAMAAAAAWLVVFGVLDAMTGLIALSLFSVAPLIAATVADERRTAVFGAAAVALAIGAGWWDGVGGCELLGLGCGGVRRQRDGGRGGGYAPPAGGARASYAKRGVVEAADFLLCALRHHSHCIQHVVPMVARGIGGAALRSLTPACIYLLCGISGSLGSLWWHRMPVLSAGASGAIFGLAGAVIASISR